MPKTSFLGYRSLCSSAIIDFAPDSNHARKSNIDRLVALEELCLELFFKIRQRLTGLKKIKKI
jgi:hypothetical protein